MAMLKPALPQRFTSELEINDYPQMARFKVMQRDSLQAIQEWTKVAITTKGTYYPPGRNAPPGERKLFMVIEGESEEAVKAAKKELRRTLEEHAAVAAPDDSSTNRYAKYSI
uniref:ATP-dependent RNA helicase PRP5/DDX46/KHDC4 KH domain-containing protein n=1 Tax=Prymnesium polylepis TaxID=72548 RepID=A0A7S4IIZ5_9EUKA